MPIQPRNPCTRDLRRPSDWPVVLWQSAAQLREEQTILPSTILGSDITMSRTTTLLTLSSSYPKHHKDLPAPVSEKHCRALPDEVTPVP